MALSHQNQKMTNVFVLMLWAQHLKTLSYIMY